MSYPRKSALPNYRSSYAKLKKKKQTPKTWPDNSQNNITL